jgi:hypothetical protein
MKSTFLILLAFALPSAFAVDPTQGLPANVKNLHLAATQNGCETDLPSGAEKHDLGQNRFLYIVPCIMGAYQGSSRVYITEGADEFQVSQVAVLSRNEQAKAIVSELELTDAGYDPKTQILSTHARGRGIGDCGQSSRTKIMVDQYFWTAKTIEIRSKPNCDGKLTQWPVVYKQ